MANGDAAAGQNQNALQENRLTISTSYGSIQPYNENIEGFTAYATRVDMYFVANKIEQDRKTSIFLACCGAKMFALATNAVAPKCVTQVPFNEIIEALKNHFKPKTLIISERFNFGTRVQEPGESIAEYVNGLKELHRTCAYPQIVQSEILRDRFVIGLKDNETVQMLLREDNLTFEKALQIATANEAARRDSRWTGNRELNRAPSVNNISKRELKGNYAPGTSKGVGTKPKTPCFGCGKLHWKKDCPHKNTQCRTCSGIGHLAAFCRRKKEANETPKRQKGGRYSGKVNAIAEENSDDDVFVGNILVERAQIKPLYYDLLLPNQTVLTVELDTGSFHNLLSYNTYTKTWPCPADRPALMSYTPNLKAYGGANIDVLGCIEFGVRLTAAQQPVQTTFVLVKDDGPSLMGRSLMQALDLTITRNQINKISSIDDFVGKYQNLFAQGLGCYEGKTFSIEVDPTVPPKFYKARALAYTMRDKVAKELERLTNEGIITPVPHAKWAAPVVPIQKPDGTIRLCGDFKLTANLSARLDCYPIPNMQDLFQGLANKTIFSKLDLSQAYAQLQLAEESKEITTINTHKGLFQFNRLPYGISNAPGLFQREMENLFKDIPDVYCYLDDLLLMSTTKHEHELLLHKVFKRLQDKGLRLKAGKCEIGVPEVVYLGFKITRDGLLPTTTKVDAIAKAPAPKDITQLRSYLGLINFYRKFIPRAATLLEPLNRLLRANSKWQWTQEQQKAFEESKKALVDSAALVHYDPNKEVTVSADSSNYGVGAVIAHVIDGVERPCHFVSRTLSETERRYSQTEKEALALVYALKSFHEYLWGRKFELVTDHKPLLGLFAPNRPISPQASGRIQRWALLLQAYDFTLVHRSGALLCTADTLSRLPYGEAVESAAVPVDWINIIKFLSWLPLTHKEIRHATETDPAMATVSEYILAGWPRSAVRDPDLIHFSRRKDELSMQDGCLMWGTRVIIPPALRKGVIEELHADHAGASRMKELARSYLWWPNLDRDLDKTANSCDKCLENRPSPPRAELHPWEWPKHAWHRIHVDFAGPVNNDYFLIIADAHSKWVDIYRTKGTATGDAIKGLRKSMAIFGLPVTIVSDNGPCFTSAEFKDFVTKSGIRHTTTAVYHAASNGLAERAVRTFKEFLKKSSEPVDLAIDRFLFNYRVTPHSTTGVSPAELMFGRKVRTRLDLLRPNGVGSVTAPDRLQVAKKVEKEQQRQKKNHCRRPRVTAFEENCSVMIRNYGRHGEKWLPATVERKTGPLSYQCRMEDGQRIKRHQDQLHKRSASQSPAPPLLRTIDFGKTASPAAGSNAPGTPPRTQPVAEPRTIPRRSQRSRKPVDRYGDPIPH